MPHLRLTYLLPPDLEDALVADLFQAGTLGVQSAPGLDGRLHLTAWFPEGASPELDIEGWRIRGVEATGREVQPDTDWLALWREKAQPFPEWEHWQKNYRDFLEKVRNLSDEELAKPANQELLWSAD